MSARVRQAFQAAAGAASGGDAITVDQVFSTNLYTGTEGSSQTITNNIDLSGEGGLVWSKARDSGINHVLMDTVQGTGKFLNSNQNYAQQTDAEGIKSFNSNGFTFGTQSGVGWSNDHVYWTFRKAPKFFDIQVWDGNGVAGREISHNLDCEVGMILIKLLNVATRDWVVYHRGVDSSSPENYFLYLNQAGARQADNDTEKQFNNVAPTSTKFTLGNSSKVNGNYNNLGWKYVAYIFADNSSEDAADRMIHCGSATISGDTTVNLGWEPQWVLYKNASANGNWTIIDSMRGWTADGAISALYPNTSGAESAGSGYEKLTSTGFVLQNYTNGHNIIYMAIRAPMMAEVTDATDVFGVKQGVNSIPAFDTGFTADFALTAANITSTTAWRLRTRLTGANYLISNNANAETSSTSSTYRWDLQTGYGQATNLTNVYGWIWKRAKGYFDVVCYNGTGSVQTVPHSLTVAPSLLVVKRRDGDPAYAWCTYAEPLGASKVLFLERNGTGLTTSDFSPSSNYIWGDGSSPTAPTSSVFTVGGNERVNASGGKYIAYLFATLAGVSKVGSYTGTGSDIDVDCGFTNGARFVLIKRADASSTGWGVIDTVRGLTSTTDAYLFLNLTTAQGTSNIINPLSSGFKVVSTGSDYNANGGTYIFYAIA